MVIVCTILISLASMIEYKIFINISSHKDYFENILLGAFASGLLVLIPSIISYYHEKKQYYLDIYTIANKLLYNILEVISHMENCPKDKELVSNMFDAVSIRYDEFVSQYSQFTYFFCFCDRDKLIESILNEVTKYILIQEKLLKLSRKLKDKEINLKTYTDLFNKIRIEIIHTYKNKLINYERLVEKDIKRFLKDRILKTYIE